jgi:GNAT superfamily N-acetyltransferase
MRTRLSHVTIRGVEQSDCELVQAVADDWSGSTRCAPLPRVLFEHFGPTGFVAELGGELVGYLLGFVSQTYPGEAYVHAVAVRPEHRRRELGTALYERFFGAAYEHYCSVVRAAAAPADLPTIAFHQALGFHLEPGDGESHGVPVRRDYPAVGESRVQFVRCVAELHAIAPLLVGDRLAS